MPAHASSTAQSTDQDKINKAVATVALNTPFWFDPNQTDEWYDETDISGNTDDEDN